MIMDGIESFYSTDKWEGPKAETRNYSAWTHQEFYELKVYTPLNVSPASSALSTRKSMLKSSKKDFA